MPFSEGHLFLGFGFILDLDLELGILDLYIFGFLRFVYCGFYLGLFVLDFGFGYFGYLNLGLFIFGFGFGYFGYLFLEDLGFFFCFCGV